jgi:hypothetical protein
MQSPVDDKLSMVRVKYLILAAIFLSGYIVIPTASSPPTHFWIFAAMGVASMLFYFVRCETCHSSIYYTAGGKRNFFVGGSSTWRFIVASKCPVCGRKRF